jgi:2-dehydro-3-deoxyphosphogluconate aldolase / (4S)-4-hydroxy-2-oxoglutarate aldolase
MATFSRLQVYQALHDFPVVAVYNHPDPAVCIAVVEACYRGGMRVFEFTNRGDMAHAVFAEIFDYIRRQCPQLILGVGTIMDAPSATLYRQMGANFVVSPVLNEEVAKVCHRYKIGWIPGVGTLSEISWAESMGAEIVKIFPGNVLKPEFIKAVHSPMPWTSMMVTGGVQPNEENLRTWFEAGVTCVGMGERLVPDAWVREGRFDDIAQAVADSLRWAKIYKK